MLGRSDEPRAIAAVNLSSTLIEGLESAPFRIERFPDLSSALDCIRSERCVIIVLGQPPGWSLERTGREVRSVCGDDRAIVLSPEGSTFAPGLYVVSDQVPTDALSRLIVRITRGLSGSLHAQCELSPPSQTEDGQIRPPRAFAMQ